MKQKNVVIAGIQNIWNPLTTCYLGCIVTDWGGIQKNINITGKNSYQILTFAYGQLLFSEFDTRARGFAETIWLLGQHYHQPETTY